MVVPQLRLGVMETAHAPVPRFRYRPPLYHQGEWGGFRWGTLGRTHNAEYFVNPKEVFGAPCWELAP